VNRTRWLLLATAVPLLIVLGVLVSAALGGGDERDRAGTTQPAATPARARPYAPPGTRRTDVGRGARGAAIFRAAGASAAPGPVVVFLHGWIAVDPRFYGAWIGHLVRGGCSVIYPAYQQPPFLDTVTPLPNALAGVGLALRQVPVSTGRLVVAGHSAGGALAADYAASARSAGLPEPAAVLSVYPGRSLRGIRLRIPAVSARNIPAGTRVLALAGAHDRVVGTRVARTIVRTATRARATLRIVRDPAADDHAAPQRAGAASRRAFWAPLDRLIAATG
jgi:acetyl esterase/lipase